MSNIILKSRDPSDVDDIALSVTCGGETAPKKSVIYSLSTDEEFKANPIEGCTSDDHPENTLMPSGGTEVQKEIVHPVHAACDSAFSYNSPPDNNAKSDSSMDVTETEGKPANTTNFVDSSGSEKGHHVIFQHGATFTYTSMGPIPMDTAGQACTTTSNDTESGDWMKELDAIKLPPIKNDSDNGHITLIKLCTTVLRDKKSCIRWLMSNGLLATNCSCLVCGMSMKLHTDHMSDGIRWTCSRQRSGERHYRSRSLRSGSWFQGSKISLEKILHLTYMWAYGFSMPVISRELCLSNNTLLEWFYQSREVCEIYLMQTSQPVGGPGKIVEVYESDFIRPELNKMDLINGQWVIGAIERYTTNVFYVPVQDIDEATLCPFVSKWIRNGSIIYSECWESFSQLSKMGYSHKTVNPNKYIENSENSRSALEREWMKAKRSLPVYGTRRKFPSGYLAESLWRMKVRNREDKFLAFLEAVKQVYNPLKPDT